MLEILSNWDHELFRTLHTLGHPYLDGFMYWMSNKFIWIPLYLYLIYRIYQFHPQHFWWVVFAALVVVAINDQLTSTFMKPFFERLRPCNDPRFSDILLLVGKCPSGYSFASGHAANSFGVAFIIFLAERKSTFSKWLLLWAAIVSYSRIYLGVHFPFDVLVGATIGCLVALLVFSVLGKVTKAY